MTLLTRMLCRWLGRPAPGPERRERAAEEVEAGEPPEVSPEDLTAIRGIGIAPKIGSMGLASSRMVCWPELRRRKYRRSWGSLQGERLSRIGLRRPSSLPRKENPERLNT